MKLKYNEKWNVTVLVISFGISSSIITADQGNKMKKNKVNDRKLFLLFFNSKFSLFYSLFLSLSSLSSFIFLSLHLSLTVSLSHTHKHIHTFLILFLSFSLSLSFPLSFFLYFSFSLTYTKTYTHIFSYKWFMIRRFIHQGIIESKSTCFWSGSFLVSIKHQFGYIIMKSQFIYFNVW